MLTAFLRKRGHPPILVASFIGGAMALLLPGDLERLV